VFAPPERLFGQPELVFAPNTRSPELMFAAPAESDVSGTAPGPRAFRPESDMSGQIRNSGSSGRELLKVLTQQLSIRTLHVKFFSMTRHGSVRKQ
jgi:hypothetical protein